MPAGRVPGGCRRWPFSSAGRRRTCVGSKAPRNSRTSRSGPQRGDRTAGTPSTTPAATSRLVSARSEGLGLGCTSVQLAAAQTGSSQRQTRLRAPDHQDLAVSERGVAQPMLATAVSAGHHAAGSAGGQRLERLHGQRQHAGVAAGVQHPDSGHADITAATGQPSSVQFMISGAFRNGLLGRS